MSPRMLSRVSFIVVSALACSCTTQRHSTPASASSISAEQARACFERLKGLEGDWTGQSTKGWTETIRYRTIAGGSCVEESSFDAHPGESMLTLFHMDGERLMLTHYCVAKNQPRLVASEVDGDTLTFTFLDATNLASRDKGHMDKVRFRFLAPDRFTSQWTWYQDGRESWMEEIVHTRSAPKAAAR